MEQRQKTPAKSPRLKPASRFAPVNLAPAPLFRHLIWRTGDALVYWRACLIAELEDRRGFLWLPVAFGIGILLYFALPREPLLVALGIAVLALASWAVHAWSSGDSYRLVVVLCLVAAGATSAKIRVDRLTGPELDRPVTMSLTGRVITIDRAPSDRCALF